MNFFKSLPDSVKGTLLMVAGIILFLHTIGVGEWVLGAILILISLYLVALGFIKVGGVVAVKKIIAKKEKEKKEVEKKEE